MIRKHNNTILYISKAISFEIFRRFYTILENWQEHDFQMEEVSFISEKDNVLNRSCEDFSLCTNNTHTVCPG